MPVPEDRIGHFKHCVMGWRDVDQHELKKITKTGRYAYGVFFTTVQCDCSKYLPCLMKSLASKGEIQLGPL